jgi:hypothetical protein
MAPVVPAIFEFEIFCLEMCGVDNWFEELNRVAPTN